MAESDRRADMTQDQIRDSLPEGVRVSLAKKFQGNDLIWALKTIKWDNLNGCYWLPWRGMFLGIEEDGYMHT